MHLIVEFVTVGAVISAAAAAALTTEAGNSAIIQTWDIQSSAIAGNDLKQLSGQDVDISSWHHVNASRCTLMGCLLEVGVYEEADLFYSDNLNNVDWSQFAVPWLYRSSFTLEPAPGQHYFVETNGITSRADIFLNGNRIADKTVQSGSYSGQTYDVSSMVGLRNTLVIRTYPTDYNYDLALGFVDWNPYPPDNGTGVWREVSIKQTGPVALGPLRIAIELSEPIRSAAIVTFKTRVQNLENETITFVSEGLVTLEADGSTRSWSKAFTIRPMQTIEISMSETYQKPALWWPKQWGEQPLYSAQISVLVGDRVSDISEKKTFALRKVTSQLNSHADIQFFINGQPFQVLGGGYSGDIFLRWDGAKFATQVMYMLDMGLNTVRLEGKMEHPELYEITDRLGLMVIAGWECCDKWEAWEYNGDLSVSPVPIWNENDYASANASMRHEAFMLQNHPSVLAYLIGSDYWPNDRATTIYLDALNAADWQSAIIASAAKRGYPEALGPSGMKMEGPYDWVPPSYWYDTEPSADRFGAAFGFGSELGAGVGTPELGSLKKFLSPEDIDDLWKEPEKGLYHMSRNVSQFYDRKIYNDGLWARYGAPSSLEDYLIKAQMMDYEATRAEFEGFAGMWNAERPATGLIYWMLTNAWPSLHWNQFDYYLHPAGSYFGTKVGSRAEHVAYDYVRKSISLINRSLANKGTRSVAVEVLGLNGKVLSRSTIVAETEPNKSKNIGGIPVLEDVSDVVLLRLVLSDENGHTLSRNVYWLAKSLDVLDWEQSTWYYTPVTEYADFTALDNLETAKISATVLNHSEEAGWSVLLENRSTVPAVFIRLNLVTKEGEDVLPVTWSDNYVTLFPNEKLEVQVSGSELATTIQISGKNVISSDVPL